MSASFSLKSLLTNFDLLTYIETNFSYKTVTGSDEYRICCVACGNPNFKLYVNIDKKLFNCFTCDFSSKNKDLFDLVAKHEGISRSQAIKQFASTFRRTVPDDLKLSDELDITYAPTELSIVQFPSGLPKIIEDTPGWDYLIKRGMTPEEITNCNIRFTDRDLYITHNGKITGNMKNRVTFPVYGPPGLVSWQGRHIDSSHIKDKYFSCPGSDLSKTLWPFVPPHDKTAIIVEGTFDALAVRRIARSSSYATFGKKISREQIALLKTWGVEELVVFFDKKDALPQIKNTVRECKNHFAKVSVPDYSMWPSGVDAGDCLHIGTKIIYDALETRIDSYSIEYTKFCLI